MSDDLTKKLREVYDEHCDREFGGYPDLIQEFIEQITQAFIDDGWIKPIMLDREQSFNATGNPVYKTPVLKSGQEWFTRFEKELRILFPVSYDLNGGDSDVVLAAKRASGIE